MTNSKLDWEDVDFLRTIDPRDATEVVIRTLDDSKKFILTFDYDQVIAKREKVKEEQRALYEARLNAMIDFNKKYDEAIAAGCRSKEVFRPLTIWEKIERWFYRTFKY